MKVEMVFAAGLAPALATLSTSCLFCWTTRGKQKWSQSRVLPSAELAYETGLSAGSIAEPINELVKSELVSCRICGIR